MMELITDLPTTGNPLGPADDERDVNTTLVRVLLVPLERCVAGLGPAPRVIAVRVRPTDLFDAVNCLVGGLDQEIEELHLVEDPERSAFLTRTVVGE